VTLLAEQARCARRPWLARQGIAERALVRGSAQDDPGRATARGTLAHACLSELDLAAPPLQRRAQLAAVASRRGYDPASKGIRRILDDVARFLESPAGRALADEQRRGRLSREVPFLLRLEAGGLACYVSGAIDALIEQPKEVLVVDYKYALASPGALERYRGQLLAYCVAAACARPGLSVRARLQFLRGSCDALDLAPTAAELEAFAREAPALAAAAAGGDPPSAPAELGRDPARCAADGCGYGGACFPVSRVR
jgi:ATP-dependent exoDNAse (exonuclease V) beta subunit